MSLRGTMATGLETASNVPDIYKLALLEDSAARFLRVLVEVKKSYRKLKSHTYLTQERRPRGSYTRINFGAGYGTTDLTFTVDSPADFQAGDTILIPRTQEQMRLETVDYTGLTITATARGLGSTATAILDDDYVMRLARNMSEGYTTPASFLTDTTQKTNYCETINTSVEWTDQQQDTASYLSADQDGSRIKADLKAMAIEHLKDIERAILFHQKSTSTDSNGKKLLITDGLIPSIDTFIVDHSGGVALTESQYNSLVLEKAYRKSPTNKKFGYTSNKVLGLIEGYGRGVLRFLEGDSQTLGFDVSAYRTGRGTVKILHHPMLDDVPYYYDECQVIADMAWIRLAMMQDTVYRPNIQNKKDHVRLDEWETKLGLDMEYEECHVFARDLITAS